MSGYDKAPPILFQKTPDGIKPYNHISAEMVSDMVNGQVFTAKPRKGRTQPRNGAYWAGLHKAVDATGAWPTAAHLHQDLKRLCGYVDEYHNPLTGRDEIRVQSSAFDKMSESEFAAYFRLAQAKFIAAMGFDAWERVPT